MEFSKAMQTRRAVKHFDSDHVIPQKTLDQFWDIVQQAPSSFNIQHWRIIDVEDMEVRKKIRAAAWDQAQVTEASKCLIICGDIKAWQKRPEQYWSSAPQAVSDVLVPMIGGFYEGKDQLQRDEVMRSCGIMAQSMMLAATSLGYDSCPMIGFDAEAVANIIKLPSDHAIGLMLVIGKGIKAAHPKGGFMGLNAIRKSNSF
jgi:nitroreductase